MMASGKLPKGALPGLVTRLIAALSALGTAGQVLKVNSGATGLEFGAGGGGFDVIIEDQKSSGSQGGTFTSGSMQTRTLNTKVYDPGSICTLASNKFTLPAGTWYIEWIAIANQVGYHQSELYNVTDAVSVKTGTNGYSNGGADYCTNQSQGATVVTIASPKDFSIRHQSTGTRATDGFGYGSTFGTTNVFCCVRIKKL